MKSPKHVVPILVALTLAAMLGGCSKNTTPTGLDPVLDMAPPAIPSQIVATQATSAGPARLEWTPSSSANAASYQIYQYSPNPTRESAYVLLGETQAGTTHYTTPGMVLEITYYRLRTTSTTGVQSAWSALVRVEGGPWAYPGGLPDLGEPGGLKKKP